MGVSGSGKTTIAKALADRLGWAFEEGDDLHPGSDIAKMHSGHPLDDRERWPWLEKVAAWIDGWRQAGKSGVITCSALKRRYRDFLARGRPEVCLLYLHGDIELIAARLAARKGHFMPASLLDSQLAALEEPDPDEHPIYADVGRPVEDIIAEIVRDLASRLSEDGPMPAWTFATHPARLPDLYAAELPEWIPRHVRVGELTLFGRPKRPRPGMLPGQVDMRFVGIQNEEQKVIAEVRAFVRAYPAAEPTLVLFFSDGGVYRNAAIEQELRAAVEEPVFWQFVGLGRADYGVLERFDTLPGRRVDNVGFFAVDDIDAISDPELYDRLLSEFPSWLTAARQAGILH